MNPSYSDAIDPIFEYVLKFLDRISYNDVRSPEEERESILLQFREAESKIGSRQGWELIKYALASWVDEMLISAPWEGRVFWTNNSLEFDFFNSQVRATRFFQQALEADKLTKSDASEVFYVCVVLGFRGFYGTRDSAFIAEQLKLPTTVEDWTRRTARKIELHNPPDPSSDPKQLEGAPALTGKFMLVGATLMTVMMAAAFAVIFSFFIWDDLFKN